MAETPITAFPITMDVQEGSMVEHKALHKLSMVRCLRCGKKFMVHENTAVMLAEDVKKYFPHAKLICIEEDVFFLNYHRRWKNAKNALVRAYWKTHYKRLRAAELHMLSLADLVVTNNPKDTEILKK